MRSNKRLEKSRFTDDTFSFEDNTIEFDKVYPDFPIDLPDYNEEDENWVNFKKETQYFHDCLVYADSHPPQGIKGHLFSTAFVCVVFQSQEQSETFLKHVDLFRYSNLLFDSDQFCKQTGVDIKKKKIVKKKSTKKAKSDFSFTVPSFDLGGFEQKKEEVSEVIKDIRQNEKKVADYMEWTTSTNFYFIITFKDEEEKKAFLDTVGMEAEYSGKYINGLEFAKLFDCKLPEMSYGYKPTAKKDPVWCGMILDNEDLAHVREVDKASR